MLIILFGLAGAGKNYVGEILADQFGYYHWDADEAIPQEMRETIAQKKIITQAMRDQFTATIISKITELRKYHQKIVISQALYKEKNRKELYEAHPESKFIQITANIDTITARLKKRNDWVDEEYAKKISENFEEPSLLYATITNESNRAAIIEQLKKII